MSTLSITINATNPDEEDRRAMNLAIDEENARRLALDPLATLLPKSTAAERKSSYETILAPRLLEAHRALVKEAGDRVLFRDIRPRWDIATDAQRAAAASQLPPLP